MRNIFSIYSLVALLLFSFLACKDRDDGFGIWQTDPLEEYKATPTYGGAIITYTVPNDPELLYIMAEYERNGQLFTEKASIYGDSLFVEGFDTRDPVQVKLYKVNREGQRSMASELEFTPLESLIRIAHDSLKMGPSFGGVIASWANPGKTPLGARLMFVNDSTGKLETKDVFYSTSAHEQHIFRGFDEKEYKFALSFEDQWGNISDTTWITAKPYFETMIPKPYKDFRSEIPYDNTTFLKSGYEMKYAWDGIVNTSHNGWLTSSGSSGLSFTIDLGQVVKLSRIVIHGYNKTPYQQVNFTKWEAWGIKKIDFNKLSDRDYWLDEYTVRNSAIKELPNTYVLPDHTFADDWQYLGFHSVIRYDLMSPPDNQGIENLNQNGSEYLMPPDAEPVRYVRIFVRMIENTMPPPGNNYFSIGEITFYGDNTVPQE